MHHTVGNGNTQHKPRQADEQRRREQQEQINRHTEWLEQNPGGDWSLAPRGREGTGEEGRDLDDSPVLAPEAEHVCVVGARLHRLEALERRHGVPEQEPACDAMRGSGISTRRRR